MTQLFRHGKLPMTLSLERPSWKITKTCYDGQCDERKRHIRQKKEKRIKFFNYVGGVGGEVRKGYGGSGREKKEKEKIKFRIASGVRSLWIILGEKVSPRKNVRIASGNVENFTFYFFHRKEFIFFHWRLFFFSFPFKGGPEFINYLTRM